MNRLKHDYQKNYPKTAQEQINKVYYRTMSGFKKKSNNGRLRNRSMDNSEDMDNVMPLSKLPAVPDSKDLKPEYNPIKMNKTDPKNVENQRERERKRISRLKLHDVIEEDKSDTNKQDSLISTDKFGTQFSLDNSVVMSRDPNTSVVATGMSSTKRSSKAKWGALYTLNYVSRRRLKRRRAGGEKRKIDRLVDKYFRDTK